MSFIDTMQSAAIIVSLLLNSSLGFLLAATNRALRSAQEEATR